MTLYAAFNIINIILRFIFGIDILGLDNYILLGESLGAGSNSSVISDPQHSTGGSGGNPQGGNPQNNGNGNGPNLGSINADSSNSIRDTSRLADALQPHIGQNIKQANITPTGRMVNPTTGQLYDRTNSNTMQHVKYHHPEFFTNYQLKNPSTIIIKQKLVDNIRDLHMDYPGSAPNIGPELLIAKKQGTLEQNNH